MTTWPVAVFIALQSLLLLLDLWETRRQSKLENDPEGVRATTVVFLIVILAVYLGLQLCGSRLVPSPEELLESVRQASDAWQGRRSAAPLSGVASIVMGVVLFYTAGFWDHWIHRCFSHSRIFWITHEYHHLPRQVTVWMPGILARPFGFIPVALSTLATAATLYAFLMALQMPAWDLRPLLPVALFIGLVLTASHSAFLRRRPGVHRVMRCLCLTTPQEHLLHHRIESRCNYGNFTTLWDRLLGTYENPQHVDLESVPLGLSYDQDFLGAITLGRLRLSAKQRQRFQISRFCNDNVDSVKS